MKRRQPALRRDDRFKTRDLRNASAKDQQRCLAIDRYAVVRPFVRHAADPDGPDLTGARPVNGVGVVATGREWIETSTLHPTAEGARALGERRDAQNRRAIRRGEALPLSRVARVRIEEAR